jgi:cytochrome c peroxidase
MTAAEKRGAILFFGSANCVACHAVAGPANEMFSDFQEHRLGVPQIAPVFGLGTGNVIFDGPNSDEDFGLEQITHLVQDRYKFRTSPLRNVGLQPTFFHNGSFTRLEDAVRHHLDVVGSVQNYDPELAGVDADLTLSSAPQAAVLEDVDPLVATPLMLSDAEVADLVQFLSTGLLDKRASPQRLRKLIPNKLPSGLPVHEFQKN